MNVTPSGKVDVGDISVSAGSSTGAEQLKPNEKQIEVFTIKFIYDCFGYLCMLYVYCICYSFQMRNKVWQSFSGVTGFI